MIVNSHLNEPNPSIWKALDWHPSDQQLKKLITLQELLKGFNQKLNLTRLVNGDDYWITQVFDSIWPIKSELSQPSIKRSIIDVGSGCGFPGLAIAIALPGAQLTLVEAINKKQEVLKSIVDELELSSRVSIRHERIELTGQNQKFRGMFDIAMARAVSKDSVVAEYLIPLIKDQGQAILFKGKFDSIDKENLNKALYLLKAQIKSINSIQLPLNRGERHNVRISPIDKCPKMYPRAIGIPKKKPLSQ